jgi:hypothetical protein
MDDAAPGGLSPSARSEGWDVESISGIGLSLETTGLQDRVQRALGDPSVESDELRDLILDLAHENSRLVEVTDRTQRMLAASGGAGPAAGSSSVNRLAPSASCGQQQPLLGFGQQQLGGGVPQGLRITPPQTMLHSSPLLRSGFPASISVPGPGSPAAGSFTPWLDPRWVQHHLSRMACSLWGLSLDDKPVNLND